jgi:opacity protein-like surface antigen
MRLPPVLPVLALSLIALPDVAGAQTFSAGPYVGFSAGGLLLSSTDGSAGSVDTNVDFAPGFDLAAQLGYRFSFLRAELEVEYGQASVDSFTAGATKVDGNGDVGILRGTIGGYLDLTIIPIIKPYAGGGVGVANVDGETAVVDGTVVGVENSTDLTAHGEIGFTWTLFPIVDLVPAYRFIWIDNGDDRIDDTTAHVFKLGTRFEF